MQWYKYYIYLTVLFINIFFMYNCVNTSISFQFFILLISIFYLFYWFISIFLFLIKKVYLNKYTTVIQRFWKRSFMLFWLIEIFLFGIYLFLICNAPEESYYMLDQSKINKNLLINMNDFFYKMLFLLYINLMVYCLLLLTKTSNKKLFLLIFYWCHILIYFEAFQLIYYNNYFYNYIYIYDNEEMVWQFESDYLKSRTYYYYLYIFILLKYWHIFFIYFYLIIYLNYLFIFNYNSYNWLSVFYQNFFFIYIFNIIYLYLFLKKFVRYYSSYEYYWFFLNINNFENLFYDILYYNSIFYYFNLF